MKSIEFEMEKMNFGRNIIDSFLGEWILACTFQKSRFIRALVYTAFSNLIKVIRSSSSYSNSR